MNGFLQFVVGALISCSVCKFCQAQVAESDTPVHAARDVAYMQVISKQGPGLEGFTLSPDGEAVSFVRGPSPKQRELYGNAPVSEVWVAVAPSWVARRVGSIGSHNARNWLPKWSPDGRYLGFVKSIGLRTSIAVWARQKRRIVMSTACLRGPTLIPGWSYQWLNSDRIVTFASSSACTSYDELASNYEQKAMADAPNAWKQFNQGVSAAVAVSALPSQGDESEDELREFGVSTHRDVVIAKSEAIRGFAVSPTGEDIAFIARDKVTQPSILDSLTTGMVDEDFTLRIARATSHFGLTRRIPEQSIMPGTLRWSPDGLSIAAITYDWGRGTSPCAVAYLASTLKQIGRVCGDIRNASLSSPLERLSMVEAHIYPVDGSIMWLDSRRMLVRGNLGGCRTPVDSTPNTRLDWYAVSVDSRSPVNLTCALANVPDSLIADNGRIFIQVAGSIYEMRAPDSALVVNLSTSRQAAELVSVAVGPGSGASLCVRRLDQGDSTVEYELLALNSPRVTSLATFKVSAVSAIACHITARQATLLVQVIETGKDNQSRYLIAQSNGVTRCLVTAKRYDIAATLGVTQTSFGYTSEKGERLGAVLTLPPQFSKRVRYPLLVIVYPGKLFSSTSQPLESGGFPWLDPVYYASKGYAVLQPSMPYSLDSTDGPLQGLTDGVAPAIRQLIETGIADSARIGVLGHSFGGTGVYGLLEQTTIFKVGVAMSAPANFIGEYGAIPPNERYQISQPMSLGSYWNAERGQLHLHTMPWQVPAVYVENSPIFFVDHITTPLLIVHGDQDRVPVADAEQMFRSLYRLGRPAQLVRYWGEGHAVSGVLNERDLANRISTWLSKYLSRDSLN